MKVFRKFFLCDLLEASEIRSRHSHINIIIPRDKAFMSDRTQQCSSECIIAQMMFLAYSQEFFQNVQLYKLKFPEIILILCFLFCHGEDPPL